MIQRILKFFFPTFVSEPVEAAKPKQAPTFTTVERQLVKKPKKRGRPVGSKNKKK